MPDEKQEHGKINWIAKCKKILSEKDDPGQESSREEEIAAKLLHILEAAK